MNDIINPDWYSVTETGLVVNGEFTEDQWLELGSELARSQKSMMWLIGDWLLAGESSGYLPRGKLDEACKRFGIAYDTAKQATRVCRSIERCSRIHHLTFNHHQEIAGREDSVELLEWAVENDATVRELRAEKKRRTMTEVSEVGCESAEGSKNECRWQFLVGDCLNIPYEDNAFDLVFCSPPYESLRSYGELEFDLEGDDWVQWAADCFMECLRVSRGLVAWVVEGRQRDFEYSYTPFLLGAELQKRGAKLRKPIVYQRQGIPGSGGTDWLRNDWEPIICATKNGRLPYFDISKTGTEPIRFGDRMATNRFEDGTRREFTYRDPQFANPGNVINGKVGSGQMGWSDATENEAPFPEWLAEFFVQTFCRPGGIVLDPFSGSGTTVSMANKHGRDGVGIDRRQSQVWLAETRLMGLSTHERKSGQGLLI
jgi:site-specific DNA-methyltransferase (adenine-specific)